MGNVQSTKQQDKKLDLTNDGSENVLKLDPRSPTAEISRTPVQVRVKDILHIVMLMQIVLFKLLIHMSTELLSPFHCEVVNLF